MPSGPSLPQPPRSTATAHRARMVGPLGLWARRGAALLACTAILLGLLRGGLSWHHQRLQRQWLTKLDQLPAERLSAHVLQALEFGPEGLDLLAMALTSRREDVAESAALSLARVIDAFELLPPREQMQREARLAAALARQIDHLPPRRQRVAARLVRQMLEREIATAAPDDAQFLADCGRVLRVDHAPSPIALASSSQQADPNRDGQRMAEDIEDVPQDPRFAVVEPKASLLPGGGLPLAPLADAGASGPAPSTDEAAGLAAQPTTPPRRLSPQALANRSPDMQTAEEVPARTVEGEEPDGLTAATDSDRSTWSPAEPAINALFRQLHAADPATVAAAHGQLRELGLSEVEIELGKQATHVDRAVRQQLAERLVGLSGIDARPWLLWLSRDADAEVRFTAVGLMATSGETAMLSRVREMSRTDGDARVRMAAEKASQGRSRLR